MSAKLATTAIALDGIISMDLSRNVAALLPGRLPSLPLVVPWAHRPHAGPVTGATTTWPAVKLRRRLHPSPSRQQRCQRPVKSAAGQQQTLALTTYGPGSDSIASILRVMALYVLGVAMLLTPAITRGSPPVTAAAGVGSNQLPVLLPRHLSHRSELPDSVGGGDQLSSAGTAERRSISGDKCIPAPSNRWAGAAAAG